MLIEVPTNQLVLIKLYPLHATVKQCFVFFQTEVYKNRHSLYAATPTETYNHHQFSVIKR